MSTEEMKVDQNGDELKQITQEREDGYKPISSKEENVNEASKNDSFDFGVSQYIQNENTLTPRALISGILIGVLIAIMNVNFGLKTGWTQGGSIFAAIISIGAFKVLNPLLPFTKEEAVITTTVASAVGHMASAGGLVSSIPALKLLGHTYTVWELLLWGLSVAYFGVYFSIPMRRQMIEVDKLSFPSGTVTAETIKAMFADGEDTVKKSNSLLTFGIGTGVFSLFSYFVPFLEKPPMPPLLAKWGWFIYFNPLLLGGGMLSGFRASASLLIGAVLGWAIIGPIVQLNHWVSGDIMHFNGVRGWILWVGVSIMTADSLMTLLFSLKTILLGLWSLIMGFYHFLVTFTKEGLKYFTNDLVGKEDDGSVPNYWWMSGLFASTILLSIIGHFVFHIQFYFVWISIPLSALLSIVATRCVGETNINPVGGMGKVTQLVFAGLAPHQITTNLLSAGIVASGASQCGDLMGDFKTGQLLNVHPKKQFIAQMIATVFGIIVCVPIYKLFDTAYQIGGTEMPAPAAHAWKAVALILSEGLSHLPLHSPWGILAGAIFGILLSTIHRLVGYWRKDVADYIPSALAIGIGFIVPPKQALSMFIGACILVVWRRVAPDNAAFYYFTVSSGMIAGEGLMGVVIAMLKLMKINPIFPE